MISEVAHTELSRKAKWCVEGSIVLIYIGRDESNTLFPIVFIVLYVQIGV